MTRARLPNRRPSITVPAAWSTADGQHHFTLTAGFCPATGALREVFYADGQRQGSQMQHTVQDACVLISLALQHGAPVTALAGSLGRVPVYGADAPASAIGVIVDALAALSADLPWMEKPE